MREHLGEEYGGVVTTATSFGLFVTLDAMYVEGLVHITELGGEYFRFDEARQELRGERSGIRYAIGSRVRVQVSRVDLDGRKIDFRLVREGEDSAPAVRSGKDRAPSRNGGSFEASASPMQNFKSAVKKAFTKVSGKPRKGDAKPSTKKSAGAPVRGPKK
jgi:ribonuclease R